jgi:hypothetical protein
MDLPTDPPSHMPADLQRLILGMVPLRTLAQMACLSKELRAVYWRRAGDRDAAVAAHVESHFTAEFREGLSLTQTALPRDLIVHPPVRGRCIAPLQFCLCMGQDIMQSWVPTTKGYCM